ncbi:MAG: hypothetical protein EBZ62_02045 [Sphingobacteriia bacterium]|nr:hypothetical protein [Sphingobacteriia bacterium]
MDTKTEFIAKVVKELLRNQFSIKLLNVENIDGYGGWFGTDEGEEEFVVAMKHHMSFEIFIHEYCHYLQWKNDRKLWDKSMITYDLLFDWIEDKSLDVTNEALDASLHDILEIEHDCEKRVLSLVQLNPIQDFDTHKYIKAVNAYLWSYHINKELRQRPKNPIYSTRVLEHMPNIFHKDLNYYLDKNNLTQSMKQTLLAEY